jgi:hypothetical protein
MAADRDVVAACRPEARTKRRRRSHRKRNRQRLLHTRLDYRECSRFIADPLLWKCG